MRSIRKIATVAAAFLVAAATGHVMQQSAGSNATASQFAAALSLPTAPVVAAAVFEALPALPALPGRLPQVDLGAGRAASAADASYDSFGRSCAALQLTLQPEPGAMIALQLLAPCDGESTAILRQGALQFAVRTDAQGLYSTRLPALSHEVRVRAILPGGREIEAVAQASGLETVNRVVLLAGSSTALRLNAFESGAVWGGGGHVSAAAPRSPQSTAGGYLMQLGDAAAMPPMLAQVYSAPVALTDVALELEALLGAGSCGLDLAATVLRIMGGQPAPGTSLTLAMPPCDGVEGAVLMPLPGLPVALARAD
jgi:hypothetical protein